MNLYTSEGLTGPHVVFIFWNTSLKKIDFLVADTLSRLIGSIRAGLLGFRGSL